MVASRKVVISRLQIIITTTMKGTITISSFVSSILFLAAGVSGSPYVVNDDRIRSLDITPVLGRGYSIATNSFQSTCLMVDETTVPSYNYDCESLMRALKVQTVLLHIQHSTDNSLCCLFFSFLNSSRLFYRFNLIG